MSYQPKTGARCGCRRGEQRDNCPACEGTGWVIDFAAIRARVKKALDETAAAGVQGAQEGTHGGRA